MTSMDQPLDDLRQLGRSAGVRRTLPALLAGVRFTLPEEKLRLSAICWR